MSASLRLDFQGVIDRVRPRAVVETMRVAGGLVEKAWGGNWQWAQDDKVLSLRDALDRTELRQAPSTLILCHFRTHKVLKPLKDIKPLLFRKLPASQLSLLQFLPHTHSSLLVHKISIKKHSEEWQRLYSVCDMGTGETREGTNERYFRKLQSEVSQLVLELEANTEMQVSSAQFSYIISEGSPLLLDVEWCELVRKEKEAKRGGKFRSLRELGKKQSGIMSPMTLRSPAPTCPNSPRNRSTTDRSTTPRLPAMSPRSLPQFGENFKEMLVLTLRKQEDFSKRPPLAQISEFVKDDEKFFELLGLGEAPAEKKALGTSMSEAGFSTASTNSSRLRKRTTVPTQPKRPIIRLFRPVLSPT